MNRASDNRLRAMAELEHIKNDIRIAQRRLEAIPDWIPANALAGLAGKILGMANNVESRVGRKLVVTLIGPSGSGKSTLVNALAGADDLTSVGIDRPTTSRPLAVCTAYSDVSQLVDRLGKENLDIQVTPRSGAAENLVLIDTPDTDSVEQAHHLPIIQEAVSLSDVLLCVFDVENPKRLDHADFLTTLVQYFDGDSIIAVLNKCDRQSETELKDAIGPDFQRYIGQAWGRPVTRLFCISARSHLADPDWADTARPRHGFDQFSALKRLLLEQLGLPAAVMDRRLDNARQLRDFLSAAIQEEVEKDNTPMQAAARRMREVEKRAVENALTALQDHDPHRLPGVTVDVYAKLAQRWMGPVGWLIAAWARWLLIGGGISRMLRYGRPIRRLSGLAASLKGLAPSEDTEGDRAQAQLPLQAYRNVFLRNWTEISELLVRARFDPALRNDGETVMKERQVGEELSMIWLEALETEVEASSRRLSNLGLQFLFNVPVLAALVHVGWITAKEYVAGSYLPVDFFVHALVTLAILLFLCFFLFQALVRLFAGKERIFSRALKRCSGRAARYRPLTTGALAGQIESFFELSPPPR
ncbi:hypothetical protein D3OALGB2SA_3578 [Olavius algarvensis associated proteobacterium Delta 3]|nr:hypothetical protein D3OALGB2SA_3578 [Olavius algarvensis associated proteobacterium Delta 3]